MLLLWMLIGWDMTPAGSVTNGLPAVKPRQLLDRRPRQGWPGEYG